MSTVMSSFTVGAPCLSWVLHSTLDEVLGTDGFSLQTGEGVNDVRKGACANHVSTVANFLKVQACFYYVLPEPLFALPIISDLQPWLFVLPARKGVA